MSLTDDWKTGKYNSGFYYYEDTNGKVRIARWYELNIAICVEILGKVPDYGYISELESKNKHLLDLQANQDDEVERLRDENEKLRLDNNQLRLLLKDSIYILNEYKHCFDVKHHNMAANITDKASEVL